MENIYVIQYKWDHGIYDLEKMIKLVDEKVITKRQFFSITRYNYDGVNKQNDKKRK